MAIIPKQHFLHSFVCLHFVFGFTSLHLNFASLWVGAVDTSLLSQEFLSPKAVLWIKRQGNKLIVINWKGKLVKI